MYEVSRLPAREMPYKKYIPHIEKVYVLKKEASTVYETYWELLCHYHICA